jgi:3-dehydroquinate synthase
MSAATTSTLAAAFWADPASFEGLPKAATALVVTNTVVAPLYLDKLLGMLRQRHASVHTVVLDDGEATKTWDSLASRARRYCMWPP